MKTTLATVTAAIAAVLMLGAGTAAASDLIVSDPGDNMPSGTVITNDDNAGSPGVEQCPGDAVSRSWEVVRYEPNLDDVAAGVPDDEVRHVPVYEWVCHYAVGA